MARRYKSIDSEFIKRCMTVRVVPWLSEHLGPEELDALDDVAVNASRGRILTTLYKEVERVLHKAHAKRQEAAERAEIQAIAARIKPKEDGSGSRM